MYSEALPTDVLPSTKARLQKFQNLTLNTKQTEKSPNTPQWLHLDSEELVCLASTLTYRTEMMKGKSVPSKTRRSLFAPAKSPISYGDTCLY